VSSAKMCKLSNNVGTFDSPYRIAMTVTLRRGFRKSETSLKPSASLCLSGAVEVRKEGLEAQINRLAELIGRLESKVRGSSYNTARSSASSWEASYNNESENPQTRADTIQCYKNQKIKNMIVSDNIHTFE